MTNRDFLVKNGLVVTDANASFGSVLFSNSSQVFANVNVVANGSVNSTTFNAGANVTLSTTSLGIGNSTANAFVNSIQISVANSTNALTLNPISMVVGSSTVNSSVISVGANATVNTSVIKIGNSIANTTAVSANNFYLVAVSANGSLGTAGQVLTSNGTSTYWNTQTTPGSNATMEFILDGGGSALPTGVYGYLEVPFAATINQVTLLADISGNVTVDIWKTTYSSFAPGTHPVVGDSITASAVPAMSSASKYQDATLTGWTTSLTAGDILAFDVKVAASNATRITCSLKMAKS